MNIDKEIDKTIDSIVDTFPINNKYIDKKLIKDDIYPIIKKSLDEMSSDFQFLNKNYSIDWFEKICETSREILKLVLCSKYIHQIEFDSLLEGIDNILYHFYNNVRPIIKQNDMDNRIKILSKFILPVLAKISAEY
jgi:hypothetical protein